MDKIPSFTIDHERLLRGIYVSRKDMVGGEVVTTFDIRMKEPNREPVLHNGAIHTIEHLAATYLRNDEEWKERIVYWGPMGCLTGTYLLLRGDYESKDMLTSCAALSVSWPISMVKSLVLPPATAATICCTTCLWLVLRQKNTWKKS